MAEELHCLRCKSERLTDLPSPEGIRFFECPRCGRRFAKQPGRSLTVKWLHPVTVVLYPVIFDDDPVPRAAAVAEAESKREPEWVAALIGEIELELADPTQDLSDTLDLRASDAKLREYLRAVLKHLRA